MESMVLYDRAMTVQLYNGSDEMITIRERACVYKVEEEVGYER